MMSKSPLYEAGTFAFVPIMVIFVLWLKMRMHTDLMPIAP